MKVFHGDSNLTQRGSCDLSIEPHLSVMLKSFGMGGNILNNAPGSNEVQQLTTGSKNCIGVILPLVSLQRVRFNYIIIKKKSQLARTFTIFIYGCFERKQYMNT